MVDFLTSADTVTVDQLRGGFFVGRPSPPPDQHLAILKGSQHAAVALEDDQVVGFVRVLSDGVPMASVPLLEVLPEHQGRGIGRTLMESRSRWSATCTNCSCAATVVLRRRRAAVLRALGLPARERDGPTASVDGREGHRTVDLGLAAQQRHLGDACFGEFLPLRAEPVLGLGLITERHVGAVDLAALVVLVAPAVVHGGLLTMSSG
jgi:GNAT superfamily N-acetyltransferase